MTSTLAMAKAAATAVAAKAFTVNCESMFADSLLAKSAKTQEQLLVTKTCFETTTPNTHI
jgi:hypothetical protein